MLARHLSRLSDTLETFGTRLREAVSSAVGETVSGIVRETVRALLEEKLQDLNREVSSLEQYMSNDGPGG